MIEGDPEGDPRIPRVKQCVEGLMLPAQIKGVGVKGAMPAQRVQREKDRIDQDEQDEQVDTQPLRRFPHRQTPRQAQLSGGSVLPAEAVGDQKGHGQEAHDKEEKLEGVEDLEGLNAQKGPEAQEDPRGEIGRASIQDCSETDVSAVAEGCEKDPDTQEQQNPRGQKQYQPAALRHGQIVEEEVGVKGPPADGVGPGEEPHRSSGDQHRDRGQEPWKGNALNQPTDSRFFSTCWSPQFEHLHTLCYRNLCANCIEMGYVIIYLEIT